MFDFYVHQRFIKSWQRLSGVERESVLHLLRLLQRGHITPGMRPHNVGVFLSLSPNMDLRVIATRQGKETTLLYVGHHDEAYRWARGTRILATETSCTELIDIRGLPSQSNLTENGDELDLPIPVQDVLGINDDDEFLRAIAGMSPEWQEWIFDAYLSEEAQDIPPVESSLVFCPANDSELIKALNLKIPSWRLFLHPSQRKVVNDFTSQSIAVTGGPGTGKTVVLLNRLLMFSPKGKDQDCSVLLTYSKGLVGYLVDILKDVSFRYYHVFPLSVLRKDFAQKSRDRTTNRKTRLDIVDERLFIQYKDGRRRHVRELIVDELQDAPPDVLETLERLIIAGSTRVIVAYDFNQSILRANQSFVNSIVALCEKHCVLTYSYRSTRQIIEKGTEWLSELGLEHSATNTFALSGPQVRFVSCQDLAHQIQTTLEVVRDLQCRYDHEGIAVVYGQYYNPSYKGRSKEEEALKTHPELRHYYRFASITKGREYFAGVLFVSKTFLSKDMGPRGNELRANTFYVALTRFRDEVTVVYPSGCSIEESLLNLASDH